MEMHLTGGEWLNHAMFLFSSCAKADWSRRANRSAITTGAKRVCIVF